MFIKQAQRFSRIFLIKIFILVAKILLRHNIILAQYKDAFGHQAWNIECYCRYYYSLYGRLPHVIAFQQSAFIPNQAIYERHLAHGVYVLSHTNFFTRLFRLTRSNCHHYIKDTSNESKLLFCRFSMNDIHTVLQVDRLETSAFPFKKEEDIRGKAVLAQMGLLPHTYICVHDRSTEYKDAVTQTNSHTRPSWGEANRAVAFDNTRNSRFDNLMPAIESLSKLAISAVRVGANPTAAVRSEHVLDYASKRELYDDFTDLALIRFCKFFVGPNSGIWLLARSFDKPVCMINVFPWPWINVPMGENSLVIPKKYWHIKDQRFLTIHEMIDMERQFYWKKFYRDDFFEHLGVEMIENSADEVYGAVTEMNSRIDGNWTGTTYPVASYLTSSNLARRSKALFPSQFVESNYDIFF